MKQEIFSFPIWDAFQADVECPMCFIMDNTEKSYISSMYRDMATDEEFCNSLSSYSFCSRHFAKLFDFKDKLGLALIMDKLLSHEMDGLKKARIKWRYTAPISTPINRVLTKISRYNPINSSSNQIYGCHLCSYLEDMLEGYARTLIRLWATNQEFRSLYQNSRGFCRLHFYNIIRKSEKELAYKEFKLFSEESFKLQEENIKRLNQELKWFIKKFNYEYANQPWKTSKDSLARCILKIKGSI